MDDHFSSQSFFPKKRHRTDFEVHPSDLKSIDLAADIYTNFGFVVLKKIIPVDLINEVHQALLEAIKMQAISNLTRDLHTFEDGTISSAHNLINYIPVYKKLQNISQILKIVNAIYGDLSIAPFNSSFFAKPKLKGLETKPHQDNAFFCVEPPEVATCWLPITFANKSNGCLYYYPKSFEIGNLAHIPEGNLGASMCLSSKSINDVHNNYERVYIELEAGDCVLHNATIVHGSEPNYSEFDRNAFNFSIASKRALRNIELFNHYQNNLNLFLQSKKSI
jgi:ectoine hydroxylase-related dioxygenase (phytanoyl-CoA dioxygenase family)